MDLVLLAVVIAGLGAAVLFGVVAGSTANSTNLFLDNQQVEWEQPGRTIQWGAVEAFYHGSRPHSNYNTRAYGLLGLVDSNVKFSQRDMHHNMVIPRRQILGLRACRIYMLAGAITHTKPVLEIHVKELDSWTVHIFEMDNPLDLLHAIQRLPGESIPMHSTYIQPQSMAATLMRQDMLGEWHDEGADQVYLAPDRIVFRSHSRAHFAQIRRISVVEHDRTSLLGRDLVRIEYQDEEQHMQVIGFLMHGSDQFAQALSGYTGVPVEMQTGRKKKEHD